jgi:hypothetical protein
MSGAQIVKITSLNVQWAMPTPVRLAPLAPPPSLTTPLANVPTNSLILTVSIRFAIAQLEDLWVTTVSAKLAAAINIRVSSAVLSLSASPVLLTASVPYLTKPTVLVPPVTSLMA